MIYILVEDITDVNFMERVFEPILYTKYNQVIYFKYARKKKEKIKQFINVIHSLNADYFLLGDYDDASNINECKSNINNKCDNMADVDNIVSVIKEIESWYLAGVPDILKERFGINIDLSDTEKYEKEYIINLKPDNLSPLLFLSIILAKYNLDLAINRNGSLNRFYKMIDKL